MEQIFTDIFSQNKWGLTKSGVGSTLDSTKQIRLHLPKIIKSLGVKSLFDAPCGDFLWMSHVLFHPGFRYLGGDIVKPLIEELKMTYPQTFVTFDITQDRFPDVDMWFCRLCFNHLSNAHVFQAIENFLRSDVKYLMATTQCNEVNEDVETGGFRSINLRKPPFCFPEPFVIEEDYIEPYPYTQMGIWTREELSNA